MEELFGWGFSELRTDTVDYLYNVPDNSSYVFYGMSSHVSKVMLHTGYMFIYNLQ